MTKHTVISMLAGVGFLLVLGGCDALFDLLGPNGVQNGDQVATPTFSPGEGSYVGTQNVTIACGTSGAAVYYTTDSAAPTTSSNLYTGAIAIEV